MNRLPEVRLLLETSLEYGRSLLRGCALYARHYGPWSLHVEPGHFRETPKLTNSSTPGGIIARIHSASDAKAILKSKKPAVLLEPSNSDPELTSIYEKFHEIRTDSKNIADMAADHLISQGLMQFAFYGQNNCPWSQGRQEVFTSYLESQSLSCSVFNEDHDKTNNQRLKQWLLSLPHPTGLMACNDILGQQVLKACAEANLSVPDQISVIGVDNDELVCELSSPPLTSIVLDTKNAGYEAAKLIDQLMSGHLPENKQIIPVKAIRVEVRRSSEPVIQDDPLVATAIRYIKDHIARLDGVPNVCSHVGVSRRTLERAFNRNLDHGIYEEINQHRLTRAKNLLEKTDLKIHQVAKASGFAHVQPMSRLFHLREKCTPLEYREKHSSQS
ncbi:DNA-binding transcriptional regulator [Verrucomicrobiaceae bacterium N1E253]|uniref:DNA-binding transcriptional regulator n=1 Tax=Oceaniferula marina TaxID=2748318 RepID=A0A851GR28_9BACT|nr:DNA-binding transcriptional regulator [Oceaniferula marina]NWK57575.1 DNA-binding transcriptional regulator [Oceaniferula marina]